jgi:hypothetical protein
MGRQVYYRQRIINQVSAGSLARELADLLFFEFYTKNSYLVDGLGIVRKTAYTYLQK